MAQTCKRVNFPVSAQPYQFATAYRISDRKIRFLIQPRDNLVQIVVDDSFSQSPLLKKTFDQIQKQNVHYAANARSVTWVPPVEDLT